MIKHWNRITEGMSTKTPDWLFLIQMPSLNGCADNIENQPVQEAMDDTLVISIL